MKTMIDTYITDDRLRDGRVVKIRAIRSEDKPILQEGMHHLSPRSLYFRFLTPKRELTEKELIYFTEVDFFHHVALLASICENGMDIPAGVGRYVMANNPALPLSADIAFAVNDEYQGLGIGTMLLKHLTTIARDAGILEFTALVLPDNKKMLHVFRSSRLPMKESVNCVGVLEIVLSLQ